MNRLSLFDLRLWAHHLLTWHDPRQHDAHVWLAVDTLLENGDNRLRERLWETFGRIWHRPHRP
jgi:hypothetical protein